MARIALVEDTPEVRRVMTAVLTDRDHTVVAFEDLRSTARLTFDPPDLLIVDVRLPDGSGLDLVTRMRDRHPDLPIVVTSGLNGEDDFRRGFVAGATDYIRKPFLTGELLAKCEAHLARRESTTTRQVGAAKPSESEPFGRYRLEGVVGRGANGFVFRARDTRDGAQVALKILSALEADTEARLRFLRETYALSAIDHPNVVSVKDFGVHEGRLYYTMQVVEGPTLRERIRGGGAHASVEDLVALVSGLASALLAIHEADLIHRDLSPANVILRGNRWDDPVLIDFGLAKRCFDNALTNKDILIGTPGYLDPALLNGAEPGPKSDLYALGNVARFAAVGEDAYAHSTGMQRIQAMRRDPPEVPASIPQPLRRVLERLVCSDPAERPSADEVLAILG